MREFGGRGCEEHANNMTSCELCADLDGAELTRPGPPPLRSVLSFVDKSPRPTAPKKHQKDREYALFCTQSMRRDGL